MAEAWTAPGVDLGVRALVRPQPSRNLVSHPTLDAVASTRRARQSCELVKSFLAANLDATTVVSSALMHHRAVSESARVMLERSRDNIDPASADTSHSTAHAGSPPRASWAAHRAHVSTSHRVLLESECEQVSQEVPNQRLRPEQKSCKVMQPCISCC